MDYIAKATSRTELRILAKEFCEEMHINCNEKVPVVKLLDVLCEKFKGRFTYDVVNDEELGDNVPALTNWDGYSFEIKIKNKIYEGAWKKEVGAFRNHILHEICHVYLIMRGFTPLMTRSFGNNEIPPYCSAEWHAKALCGEIMMPYNATIGMSAEEIVEKYKVSLQSAQKRLTY